MSKTIWVGAVAYDPKVVTIWEGMRRYFHEEADLPVEVVLFQSYEAQVLALVRDLARRGKGIVLVSSQLDELISACDRIAVLRRGALEAPRAASAWTEEQLLLEALS